jgi:hypothetical protein
MNVRTGKDCSQTGPTSPAITLKHMSDRSARHFDSSRRLVLDAAVGSGSVLRGRLAVGGCTHNTDMGRREGQRDVHEQERERYTGIVQEYFHPMAESTLERCFEEWLRFRANRTRVRMLELLFRGGHHSVVHGCKWWEERQEVYPVDDDDHLKMFLCRRINISPRPRPLPYCPDRLVGWWRRQDHASVDVLKMEADGSFLRPVQGAVCQGGCVHHSLFDELWCAGWSQFGNAKFELARHDGGFRITRFGDREWLEYGAVIHWN